jgi:hypothetical protein
MQGRLFGLMAVGKKESSQMDHKIGGAAVAGVLNLGNVLELVDDGLNDGSFAHQEHCESDKDMISTAGPCEHFSPLHLSVTVCLLIGIATRGLSHRETRIPRRSFCLNHISY